MRRKKLTKNLTVGFLLAFMLSMTVNAANIKGNTATDHVTLKYNGYTTKSVGRFEKTDSASGQSVIIDAADINNLAEAANYLYDISQ